MVTYSCYSSEKLDEGGMPGMPGPSGQNRAMVPTLQRRHLLSQLELSTSCFLSLLFLFFSPPQKLEVIFHYLLLQPSLHHRTDCPCVAKKNLKKMQSKLKQYNFKMQLQCLTATLNQTSPVSIFSYMPGFPTRLPLL